MSAPNPSQLHHNPPNSYNQYQYQHTNYNYASSGIPYASFGNQYRSHQPVHTNTQTFGGLYANAQSEIKAAQRTTPQMVSETIDIAHKEILSRTTQKEVIQTLREQVKESDGKIRERDEELSSLNNKILELGEIIKEQKADVASLRKSENALKRKLDTERKRHEKEKTKHRSQMEALKEKEKTRQVELHKELATVRNDLATNQKIENKNHIIQMDALRRKEKSVQAELQKELGTLRSELAALRKRSRENDPLVLSRKKAAKDAKSMENKLKPHINCTKYVIGKLWMENYEELCAFHNKYGHCNVPKSYKKTMVSDGTHDKNKSKLFHFVSANRTNHRMMRQGHIDHGMTPAKIQLLNKIGFMWSQGPTHNFSWDERLKHMLEFKDEYGHVDVAQKYSSKGMDGLGNWVNMQRRHYRLRKLPEDKIEKLEEIGFKWSLRDRGGTLEDRMAGVACKSNTFSVSSTSIESEEPDKSDDGFDGDNQHYETEVSDVSAVSASGDNQDYETECPDENAVGASSDSQRYETEAPDENAASANGGSHHYDTSESADYAGILNLLGNGC